MAMCGLDRQEGVDARCVRLGTIHLMHELAALDDQKAIRHVHRKGQHLFRKRLAVAS